MRVLPILAFALAFALFPHTAHAQNLVVPLDCRVGQECFVQNYADWDAGPGATDPMCGPLTYDGHDGLDFRVPKALADRGVAVLSPAPGIVHAVRDGELDGAFIRGGMSAIANKECGNGVIIDHADGWQTQLCHMRNGSLRVHAGDHVTAGQPVGLVGLSGHTQFPHVHLTLRHNGDKVDPITGGAIGAGQCGAAAIRPSAAIWSASARAALAYTGERWFAAGFTGAAPAQGIDAESLPAISSRSAPALAFWALAIGPRNGDVLRVRLYGPDGALLVENARTQPRDQAQAWLFAGRRTPPTNWPAGAYRGEAALLHNGQVVQTRTETLQLR
ncbi:MAG: M23 family metallopeptidase [Terricaulis sp.]